MLEGLNEKQKEGVLSIDGPVMVMAGAGSGKTKVLTTRIAHILKEKNLSIYEILAVTFTNKAANEMKERVGVLLNANTRNMFISTFHSFAVRILRMHMDKFKPYTSDFQIIDSDDVYKIIREIYQKNGLKDTILEKHITKYISLKQNGSDFIFDDEKKTTFFDNVYALYEKYKVENNLLDFDDLLMFLEKLFVNNKEILEKYQDKFKYILVDEFQDTNVIQYNIIKLLAGKHKNIFVVGDEDQSIYSFRGANIENVQRFLKDFNPVKVVLLEENYRCTPGILDIANKVIKYNQNRIEKTLFTNNESNSTPIYNRVRNSFEEASYVVDKIEFLKEDYDYKDFAILYRSNFLSRQIEDALVKKNLPYRIFGGLSFFQRKEIKDILSYLRLIVNLNDNYSFKRIVNEPKRKIGDKTISELEEISNENNCSLFNAITANSHKKLVEFRKIISSLRDELLDIKVDFYDPINIKNFIESLLLKTGYKQMLIDSNEYDRLENIDELVYSINESVEKADTNSLYEALKIYLQDISLRTDETTEDYSTKNYITLATFHQAKGLEFKVVFLIGFDQGIFPSAFSFNSQFDLEEERRICYVGITRAKEKLYITSSETRYKNGNIDSNRPSQFIQEMELLSSVVKNKVKTAIIEKEENIVEDVIFKCGDKISHKIFGDGIVCEVNDDKIKVAFEDSVKIMLKNHPSIRKL